MLNNPTINPELVPAIIDKIVSSSLTKKSTPLKTAGIWDITIETTVKPSM